jgi:hypothetical protein
MMRKLLATLALSAATIVGGAATAQAQTAPTTVNPVKCVGAAEHKQAQALRLQAAQADLAGLQLRRAAAAAAGRTAQVARIDGRIARVTARIAKIQANQVAFAVRCP